MIAGLPKAPSAFNPLANSERSLIRRNWILFPICASSGFIDDTTYQAAVQEPVTARRHFTQTEVDVLTWQKWRVNMRLSALAMRRTPAASAFIRRWTVSFSRLPARPWRMACLSTILRHGGRGAEQHDIAPSLVEAQERTATQGLEEELAESPEIRQTARQAAERSQTEIAGVEGDVSNWLQVLERTPNYGLLKPAIVVESGGREMRATTRGGELKTINWDGLSWADYL